MPVGPSRPRDIQPGQVISARRLNETARAASAQLANGQGGGFSVASTPGGKMITQAPQRGLKRFEVVSPGFDIDSSATEDIWRGECVEVWYVPSEKKYVKQDAKTQVFSFDLSGIAIGDQFFGAFNTQSGRWEKVSATGGIAVPVSQVITVIGKPTGGTMTIKLGDDVVTVPFDATPSTAQSALQGIRSEYVDKIAVAGGPLPTASLVITWDASLNSLFTPTKFPTLVCGWAGLTGGSGVGVLVSYVRV